MRVVSQRDLGLLGGFVATVVVFALVRLDGSRVTASLAALVSQSLPVATAAVLLVLLGLALRRFGVQADRATTQSSSDGPTFELATFASLSGALSSAADVNAVRAAAERHLPLLLPGRGLWLTMRDRSERAVLATAVAVGDHAQDTAAGPTAHVALEVCFPLLVDGVSVGTLGVSGPTALTDDARRIAASSASLLALTLRLIELKREAQENGVRDAVTGCFTRAHALEVLEVELRRARRTQMPLSILMMEVDLAALPEPVGEIPRDTVMAAAGRCIKTALRGSDVKCRYAANSFLVLLPDTPLGGAVRVSEKLMRQLEANPLSLGESTVAFTVTFGVASVRSGETDATATLARAQEALGRASSQRRPAEPEVLVAVPA